MKNTTNKKRPEDMTLDELLEAEKARPSLTEEERDEQIAAIALAELRRAGDDTTTMEDMEAVVRINKAAAAA